MFLNSQLTAWPELLESNCHLGNSKHYDCRGGIKTKAVTRMDLELSQNLEVWSKEQLELYGSALKAVLERFKDSCNWNSQVGEQHKNSGSLELDSI